METTQSAPPTDSLWSASVVKQSWAECRTRPHSMETQVDEYSGERSGNGCCLGWGHRSLPAYIQPPIHHKLQVLSSLHGQSAPSLCCCLGWVQPQCTTTCGAPWGFCLPSPQVSQGSSVLKLYHLVASATAGIINVLKTHTVIFQVVDEDIKQYGLSINPRGTPEGLCHQTDVEPSVTLLWAW